MRKISVSVIGIMMEKLPEQVFSSRD